MAVRFQLTIDCANPDLLARFWAAALGYDLEAPPTGFGSWDDYWRDRGLPEEDLGIGEDRILDPSGEGPPIWFQVVPEPKTLKNRIHIDIDAAGGRDVALNIRRERVDDEVRRLTELGATVLRLVEDDSLGQYAVSMVDPEGNEFDVY